MFLHFHLSPWVFHSHVEFKYMNKYSYTPPKASFPLSSSSKRWINTGILLGKKKKKMNELLIQAKIQMRCKRKWTLKAPWHTVRFHFQDLLEKKNQMDREKPN